MIKIEALKNYTIPYCGNKRIQPYGDLVISEGESRKTCKIKDDGAKQYITFNRKRYYVRNAGRLYSPKFVIIGSIEDAAETLKEAGYKYEIQSDTVLMVYYKDNSNDHTQVSLCDDSRYGYYMIEGRIYWREHSSCFFPRTWRDGEHPDKKHMVAMARKETRDFLLVDGELYKVTSEPRYCINVFGLGHNHGGTGMFCDYHYNPNIRKESYFSALQGEQAVAYANKVAVGRGDTKDVGKFKPFIVCHMPELVKVKPNKQHGNGNDFMNAMENVINNSDSQAEAGIMCIALAMAGM